MSPSDPTRRVAAPKVVARELPIDELRALNHRSPNWYAELGVALRRDTKKLDREIEDYLEDPAHVERYHKQFTKELNRATPTTAMRRSECIARVSGFDLVFVSDVHTAIGAQNVCAELLEKMGEGGPVALVLEIAKQDRQEDLDAFAAGRIKITTLEKRLNWGFAFDGYARQLQFAKAHGIPLIAGNSTGILAERDTRAAEIIARTRAEYGGGHLVARSREALAAAGMSPSIARVFTGDLSHYSKLAGKGLFPQAVRFDESTFCVFANKPRPSRKGHIRYLDELSG
jgi:hypothetical protein